jgi:hypothetical protein
MFFRRISRATLGFLVSARGIEANQEKIQAILTMGKPTKLHDVQKLTGRVAALSRFIARLGEKALPFYALMKKSDDKFEWIGEADTAFTQLKKVLSTPLVLVAPNEKEPLLLYIAATHQVVSTVLVVERSAEGKSHGVQRPVYFVSEVLSPTKQRYPHFQKLAYSVFTIARKLRQYFAVHPIIVVNEAPLSNILNNPSATGRLSLWGIELSPLDIMDKKKKGDQIATFAGFHGRVAGVAKHRAAGFIKCMDNVLRRIKKIPRRRSRSSLDITTRRQVKICFKDEYEYEPLHHGMKMAKACGAT